MTNDREGDTMKITTNNVPRDVIEAHELEPAEPIKEQTP